MIHDVPSTHRTAAEGPVPTGSAQNRLAGKRALITGAGQGIGRETAALFAAHGATVWASDLNVTALDGLAGCRPIALDVTDADAIRALGDEIGEIDVLFNCAGMVVSGTVLDCSEGDRSEEHTSELQSLMRISYAVF